LKQPDSPSLGEPGSGEHGLPPLPRLLKPRLSPLYLRGRQGQQPETRGRSAFAQCGFAMAILPGPHGEAGLLWRWIPLWPEGTDLGTRL